MKNIVLTSLLLMLFSGTVQAQRIGQVKPIGVLYTITVKSEDRLERRIDMQTLDGKEVFAVLDDLAVSLTPTVGEKEDTVRTRIWMAEKRGDGMSHIESLVSLCDGQILTIPINQPNASALAAIGTDGPANAAPSRHISITARKF